MIDRKELKAEAREILRETKPRAIWVTLMVTGILFILQGLSLNVSGDLETYRAMFESAMAGQMDYNSIASGTVSPVAWLLTLALDLMVMVISVGYSLYILRLSRRRNPSFGDVFDAFGVFLRAIWISLLRSIVISLWSFAYALPATLLGTVIDPVIAALVCLPLLAFVFMAAYSYRLAVFITLDEPDYSCGQCMAMSRLAMRGRRWELFRLDLSFIGWILLCIVPFVFLWVEPYMGVTCAAWYDRIMPGFKDKLERDLAERRQNSGYRPPARGEYHVPGDPREDEDPGSDGSDGDE